MTSGELGALGFLIAGATTAGATPIAIALARRADFYDRPREYRHHASATPFLGGAAVLLGFLIAVLAVVGPHGRLLIPIVCAVPIWLLGTLDDAVAVPPKWRLLAVAAVAVGLDAAGLGWHTLTNGPLNLALTLLWTVGLVNAFNLMDNLDGACSTVASVSAAGIGVLAAIKGETMLAGLAFALSGACAGFLPWNLAARPARIFLGDGGSMPIGFLVATLGMEAARQSHTGRAGILAGALLVGLPILDVALVSYSRMRRGVPLVTGGRDHLTHRILLVARSPQAVAIVLAALQLALCGLAITGYELGTGGMAMLALCAFVTGASALWVLDTHRWRPAGIATARKSTVVVATLTRESAPLDLEPVNPAAVGVEP